MYRRLMPILKEELVCIVFIIVPHQVVLSDYNGKVAIKALQNDTLDIEIFCRNIFTETDMLVAPPSREVSVTC